MKYLQVVYYSDTFEKHNLILSFLREDDNLFDCQVGLLLKFQMSDFRFYITITNFFLEIIFFDSSAHGYRYIKIW